MSYRDDARPKCEGCGLSFAESALAFDGEGRRVCRSCGNHATVAKAEDGAMRAHRHVQLARRLVLAAVAIVVVVYLVALWKQAEPRRRQETWRQLRSEAASAIAAAERSARVADGLATTQPCDPARLGSKPLAWAEMDLTEREGKRIGNESARFRRLGLLPHLEDGESPEKLAAVKTLVDETRVLVVLGWTSREGAEDRGTLVVLDVTRNAQLCWAPLAMPVDRNHSHVAPRVEAVGNRALAMIAPAARLEPFLEHF